jgi:hypothetical protein
MSPSISVRQKSEWCHAPFYRWDGSHAASASLKPTKPATLAPTPLAPPPARVSRMYARSRARLCKPRTSSTTTALPSLRYTDGLRSRPLLRVPVISSSPAARRSPSSNGAKRHHLQLVPVIFHSDVFLYTHPTHRLYPNLARVRASLRAPLAVARSSASSLSRVPAPRSTSCR